MWGIFGKPLKRAFFSEMYGLGGASQTVSSWGNGSVATQFLPLSINCLSGIHNSKLVIQRHLGHDVTHQTEYLLHTACYYRGFAFVSQH